MKRIVLATVAALALPLTAAAHSPLVDGKTVALTTSNYLVKGKISCQVLGTTLKPVNVTIKVPGKTVPMAQTIVFDAGTQQYTITSDVLGLDGSLGAAVYNLAYTNSKLTKATATAINDDIEKQTAASMLRHVGYDFSYDNLTRDDSAKVPYQQKVSISKKKVTITEKAAFQGQIQSGACNVAFTTSRKSSGSL